MAIATDAVTDKCEGNSWRTVTGTVWQHCGRQPGDMEGDMEGDTEGNRDGA